KTIALLTLMGMSGLQIPAQPGSRTPVLPRVLADIGDEQSIQQSLSTFSSHLRNVVATLRDAEPGDLVLLDEIGAGTDPDEGAALAMAVLSTLLRRNVLVAATTHYPELKAFALTTPGARHRGAARPRSRRTRRSAGPPVGAAPHTRAHAPRSRDRTERARAGARAARRRGETQRRRRQARGERAPPNTRGGARRDRTRA